MKASVVAVLVLSLAGCGSDQGNFSVDVSGEYTGTVTNGANSCPGTWDTGNTSNVSVTAAQTGTSVSLQVKDALGLLLLAVFGTSTFSGSAGGTHVSALIMGSAPTTAGGCQYTFNGNLAADLSGDTMTGTISYTPKTNGNADCNSMGVTGCSRNQSFTMTRPTKTP